MSLSPVRRSAPPRYRVHLGCQWSRYSMGCSPVAKHFSPLSNTTSHSWQPLHWTGPGPSVEFWPPLHFLSVHRCALRVNAFITFPHSCKKQAMNMVQNIVTSQFILYPVSQSMGIAVILSSLPNWISENWTNQVDMLCTHLAGRWPSEHCPSPSRWASLPSRSLWN